MKRLPQSTTVLCCQVERRQVFSSRIGGFELVVVGYRFRMECLHQELVNIIILVDPEPRRETQRLFRYLLGNEPAFEYGLLVSLHFLFPKFLIQGPYVYE